MHVSTYGRRYCYGIPKQGEAVTAVCVHKAGSDVKPHELIDFVGARIARYKKPKYATLAETLARDEDGGIDREKVKAEAAHF